MNKLKVNVRLAALDTVSDDLIRLYHRDLKLVTDAYLQGIMSQIEDLSAKLTTAIKSDKIVSKLAEADDRRDEVLRLLGALLNGYKAIPMPEKKSAAEQLLAIFNKYKGIVSERYAEESSHIESLLEDFANCGAAIGKLEGVEQYLTDLRAAQDAFQQVHDEYLRATSGKAASATSFKKPLLAAINDDLLPYLALQVKMNGAMYGAFAAAVEEEIEQENRK